MIPREISRSKDVAANSTGKSGKSGPRPWELDQYIYKESSKDDGGPSHGDPRLEFALQSYDRHQTDSDFRPSDDYGYGYPVFGTMPDLSARASSASELGTLAGGERWDELWNKSLKGLEWEGSEKWNRKWDVGMRHRLSSKDTDRQWNGSKQWKQKWDDATSWGRTYGK